MIININELFEHKFVGLNIWYVSDLMLLDKERLIRELDYLKSRNIRLFRVFLGGEGEPTDYKTKAIVQSLPGVYNENVLENFDFFLVELQKRNMKVIIVLENFWFWSGGISQYVNWVYNDEIMLPNPFGKYTWTDFQNYSERFFICKKAQDLFDEFLVKIIGRKNKANETYYKNNETIFSWEIMNEPRVYNYKKEYIEWIEHVSRLIKTIDGNHLLTIGSEGHFITGETFILENKLDCIDFITAHIWPENWNWYNCMVNNIEEAIDKSKKFIDQHLLIATELCKPIIFEEFGLSRDFGLTSSDSATKNRDYFFNEILDYMFKKREGINSACGALIWSWSGEGIPTDSEVLDNSKIILGDPPHEKQGWYSIYNSDKATIDIISKKMI